jgi:hypothetical protein
MSGAFALAPAPLPQAAAERLLLDAARRLQRQPDGLVAADGLVAMVLQLSRLTTARPHHRRIARAMMQDVAQRQDGQVFVLRNGDIVLICRATPARRGSARIAGRDAQGDLAGLPAMLERLMRVDAPEPGRLVAQWRVAADPQRLTAYAEARLAETVASPPAEEEPAGSLIAIGQLTALATNATAIDLIQRQTAVHLLATHGPGADAAAQAGVLRPIFCELDFSVPALEARAGLGMTAEADPFLRRHLAARLDQRMLELVAEAIGTGGPLDPLRQRAGTPPLHLNLALPAVLSDGFAALAVATRASGVALGVEIAFSEACADPDGWHHAREATAATGVVLALDGVTHLALGLSQPWALGADMIKLDWSPRLATLPDDQAAALQTTLRRCGGHRLLLHRADSEAAIRWGLARGIRRFQGRHSDAMLAAARVLACPRADGCTLRQCMERASAVAAVGRIFCRNHALLDAGAPTADAR